MAVDRHPSVNIADRPIFICYRQVDGKRYARWTYSALKKTLESKGDAREVYFDQTAPASSDWTSIHGPALRRAGSLVMICTPGLWADQGSDDWVHREIDWWLKNRKAAPILVDTTGEGARWIPSKIRTRWPNAQRVNLDRELWPGTTDQEQAVLVSQVAEQILGGVSGSQFEIVHEDLVATRQLNRLLILMSSILVILLSVVALLGLYADRQRRVANRNLSAALAERALREGRERYDLGLLLTAEARRYADTFDTRNAYITLLQMNPTVMRFFSAGEPLLVSPDERRFITKDFVWDIRTGQATALPKFGSWILPLAFRSDGQVAAFCGGKEPDNNEYVWIVDLRNDQNSAQFGMSESSCIGAVGTFTADGQRLLMESNGLIHIWDLKTLREHITPMEKWAHERITFDSRGTLAAGGNKRGAVTVWSVATGGVINSSTQHAVGVTSLAFNNSADLLASADESGSVIVWSLMPLRPKLRGLKHYEGIEALAFTPDGLRLAAGGPTTFGGLRNLGNSLHRISVWNLKTGEAYKPLLELRSPIWSLHFIEGGRKLIAGGVAESRLLDVSQDFVSVSPSQAIAPSPSRRKVMAISDQVIASSEGDILTLASRSDEQGGARTYYRIPVGVEPLSFAAFNRIVAVGGRDGSLLVTYPEQSTLKLLGKHPSEIDVLNFSSRGNLLTAGGKLGNVSVWEVQHAKALWAAKVTGDVRAVAVAEDGMVAAGGWASNSSKGFLFLLSAGDRRIEVERVKGVSSLAFSPDGTTLAVGHGTDILLLNTKSLARSEGLFHGEKAGGQTWQVSSESLTFSPDGQLLFSAGPDGRVRVFDVTERKPIGIGFGVPGAPEQASSAVAKEQWIDLSHVIMGKDGKLSAIANAESLVQWRLGPIDDLHENACGVANRNFTLEEWREFFPATRFRVTCTNVSSRPSE